MIDCKKRKKAPNGRKSTYNEAMANEVCQTIATTSKGIRRLCEEKDHWPNVDTLYTWMHNEPSFAEKYLEAKQKQVQVLVDEIIEISDDGTNDITINKNGEEVMNTEYVQRSRLRVESRKWIAQRLAPKLYADRTQQEVTVKSVSLVDLGK